MILSLVKVGSQLVFRSAFFALVTVVMAGGAVWELLILIDSRL